MTSPHEPPSSSSSPSFGGGGGGAPRPASFDDWLQAFKEQMTFFTGLTFASLQMGIAVMSMKPQPEDDEPAGSRQSVDQWELQRVPIVVRKRR